MDKSAEAPFVPIAELSASAERLRVAKERVSARFDGLHRPLEPRLVSIAAPSVSIEGLRMSLEQLQISFEPTFSLPEMRDRRLVLLQTLTR